MLQPNLSALSASINKSPDVTAAGQVSKLQGTQDQGLGVSQRRKVTLWINF
jgi:hypothetical protein